MHKEETYEGIGVRLAEGGNDVGVLLGGRDLAGLDALLAQGNGEDVLGNDLGASELEIGSPGRRKGKRRIVYKRDNQASHSRATQDDDKNVRGVLELRGGALGALELLGSDSLAGLLVDLAGEDDKLSLVLL
jgi:hypothetical protein